MTEKFCLQISRPRMWTADRAETLNSTQERIKLFFLCVQHGILCDSMLIGCTCNWRGSSVEGTIALSSRMLMGRLGSPDDKVPSTERAFRTMPQPNRLESVRRAFHILGRKGFSNSRVVLEI